MFLSPTTAICDNSIRRHLEAIANIAAVAAVASLSFNSYCIHKHQRVEMAVRESWRRRRHDGAKSDTHGNGRDAFAMTSATPAMKIRGSVRLFWNDNNGHEVNPNSFWY